MAGELDADAGRDADGDEDPRDRLDALRERIRSGDLSGVERDQLDQLVFGVAVADRRACTAARDFPGEVAVQRAVSAGAWATVATQLRVMLGQRTGRLDGDPPPASGRARS
ncbi:MAG: hypothetical protein GEU83_09945 [Pseudonocardiaceae bacterium]|nr:hypothetical protein [Pseudonocardiaceae bacterium]